MAGTATTSSPGRSTRRSVSRRRHERLRQERSTVEMEQVEREERRRTRRCRRRDVGRARPSLHVPPGRRRRARHRGWPSARRPGPRAPRARGVPRCGPRRRRRRSGRCPSPAARPVRSRRSLARRPTKARRGGRPESKGFGKGPRQHRPQVRKVGQLVGLESERELVGHRRSMVDPWTSGHVRTIAPVHDRDRRRAIRRQWATPCVST